MFFEEKNDQLDPMSVQLENMEETESMSKTKFMLEKNFSHIISNKNRLFNVNKIKLKRRNSHEQNPRPSIHSNRLALSEFKQIPLTPTDFNNLTIIDKQLSYFKSSIYGIGLEQTQIQDALQLLGNPTLQLRRCKSTSFLSMKKNEEWWLHKTADMHFGGAWEYNDEHHTVNVQLHSFLSNFSALADVHAEFREEKVYHNLCAKVKHINEHPNGPDDWKEYLVLVDASQEYALFKEQFKLFYYNYYGNQFPDCDKISLKQYPLKTIPVIKIEQEDMNITLYKKGKTENEIAGTQQMNADTQNANIVIDKVLNSKKFQYQLTVKFNYNLKFNKQNIKVLIRRNIIKVDLEAQSLFRFKNTISLDTKLHVQPNNFNPLSKDLTEDNIEENGSKANNSKKHPKENKETTIEKDKPKAKKLNPTFQLMLKNIVYNNMMSRLSQLKVRRMIKKFSKTQNQIRRNNYIKLSQGQQLHIDVISNKDLNSKYKYLSKIYQRSIDLFKQALASTELSKKKQNWIMNKPYEYKIKIQKFRCECEKFRPWICSYLFQNHKMLFESQINMNEYKKVLIDKFKLEFDKIYEEFQKWDERNSRNTGKGLDMEMHRVKDCILGVRSKTNSSRHYPCANNNQTEFNKTKSKFKDWRKEQILSQEKEIEEKEKDKRQEDMYKTTSTRFTKTNSNQMKTNFNTEQGSFMNAKDPSISNGVKSELTYEKYTINLVHRFEATRNDKNENFEQHHEKSNILSQNENRNEPTYNQNNNNSMNNVNTNKFNMQERELNINNWETTNKEINQIVNDKVQMSKNNMINSSRSLTSLRLKSIEHEDQIVLERLKYNYRNNFSKTSLNQNINDHINLNEFDMMKNKMQYDDFK